MAEESEGPPLDAVPGGGGGGEMSIPGVRKLSLRAEIDTSPPFGSVKEAVDRFGGSGPWVPFYKLAHEIGEIDIKKVEEQATALEKDLIVKELETLDILEELNTTKRIVEELKRQLKDEAFRCMKQRPPEFPSETKKMNNEQDQNWGPSSDLILMELKQAKLNLGRTIQELGTIQNSVENLNKKMKMEKDLLGKILESKEVKKGGESERNSEMKSKLGDEVKIKMVDQIQGNLLNSVEKRSIPCLRTAEMRLIAAKKMEEAARAAEAVAIAEIRSLSAGNAEEFYGFFVPEPEESPPTPRIPMQKFPEPNLSPFSISQKLQEATQEVKQSKMALEEALSKMELASKKQIAAEEALRRWTPEQDLTPLTPSDHTLHHHRPPQRSPLHALMNPIPVTTMNDARPSLKPQVSMRDVLSRKQVTPEECVVKRQSEVAENGRQKVALSQMLHQVREDAAFPAKRERDVEEQRAPPLYPPRTERRRFGFIHIALPMAKQSKKKPQVPN